MKSDSMRTLMFSNVDIVLSLLHLIIASLTTREMDNSLVDVDFDLFIDYFSHASRCHPSTGHQGDMFTAIM